MTTDADALDGCDLDFTEEPATSATEAEGMLVPEGEEEDEDGR
jgi:hypothetical protein